jgi:hypothetical protein
MEASDILNILKFLVVISFVPAIISATAFVYINYKKLLS